MNNLLYKMQLIKDEILKDAICNNNIYFLKQNIDNFNINHRFKDEDNETLLSYAISDSKSNVYKFFLDKNAKTNLINDEGENILHSAIYSGILDRVKQVLNKDNINGKSKDGTTPLLLSLSLENQEISSYLIDNGACINCSDLEGNLPIHLASFFGLKQIVLKLIQKGSILSKKTKKGNLPLALAVNNGHTEIIEILYTKIFKK